MKNPWFLGTPVFLISFALTPHIVAQAMPDTAEGYIPYQSYSVGDIDSVSMANGNLLLNIPILSYPQRGKALALSFRLYYSNAGWQRIKTPTGSNAEAWAEEGPSGVTFALNGVNYYYVTNVLMHGTPGGGQENPAVYYRIATIYSSDGSAHLLEEPYGRTTDAPGMSVYMNGNSPIGGIIDRNGIRSVPISDPNPNYDYATALQDTDGNEITQTSTGWVDTVGRPFPATLIQNSFSTDAPLPNPLTPLQPGYILRPGVPTSNLSACPANATIAYVWNVPASASSPTGSTAPYTFCYATIGFTSDFGSPNVSEGFGGAQVLVALALPNNTSWNFTYNSWGELSTIGYPTGGLLSYQWANSPFPGSRVVSSRTYNAYYGSASATWNYQWGVGGNLDLDVETSPPDSLGVRNDTVEQIGLCPGGQKAQYYSGSYTSGTLLKTLVTNFSGTQNPYAFLSPSYNCGINVVPVSTITTWPNGQTSQTVTTYDSGVGESVRVYNVTSQQYTIMPNQVLLGIPVLKQEYDYGATSPTRQTATTYLWQEKSGSAYWTANLLTLPASVVTKDGNGNRVAETDYTYDQSAYLTTSGITVQSSPPNGTTRGNLTTATRWLNTGTSPVSHTNWYDTGEVYQQIDPLTYTTAYNYSSAYAGSLPTSITNALGQTIIYTYDFNTGKVTSEKDPNNQIATYTYADPLARLTNVTYPDGGQKTYTYNDTASPVNVVASKLATPNPSVQQEFDVDGLGREITSKLLTDPDGVDYVTTTYDGPGRVNTVTNQYRTTSDPTYGLTTAYYDGLNRKTSEKGPDGSIQIWQYSGSTVTYTDQDQNSWKRTSDGFGRLVTVMEPNGLSQSPTMQTSYSYDLLNNLLSVTQWGGASGSQGVRARSFSYDSLSRLLTATNPETGTVCYGAWSGAACAGGYDVDGNLKVKTDARSVVVNYAYDHLNRLLSKSYANDHSGTLFSCYQYDSSAPASCGASPNLVGRLVNEWTQSPSVGACALALPSAGFSTRRSILAYDAMGRVRCEQQCTPSNCASSSSYSPTYAYDFAGDLESLGVGTASFSYSYQGAGRLLTLTSNGTGPTFSGPLFSAQTGSSTPCPGSTSASYAAFGGLMNAAYGNGLTLNRGYDTRLRTTCETDTGSLVINPTSSSATVTITGKEQSN